MHKINDDSVCMSVCVCVSGGGGAGGSIRFQQKLVMTQQQHSEQKVVSSSSVILFSLDHVGVCTGVLPTRTLVHPPSLS